MRRTLAASIAVIVSVTGLSIAGGAPAMAAPNPAPQSNNCWVDAITFESLCVEPGGDLVATVLREKGVQIKAPEGVQIGGKPFRASDYAALSSAVDVTPQASYVVSIVYDNISYGGGSTTMTGNSAGCSGYAYGYVSLNAIGWRGRVSSYKSFMNCRTAVFDLEYYGGAQYGYTINASQLGAMNDKADSWRAAL